jgi:hypothetical protein
VLTALFTRLAAEGEVRGRVALAPVALAVERQAKINASTGQHRYGTPTPAWPGSGPARISGTLVRSITHSDVHRTATGWEVLVGTATGLYPTYSRRTPANKYGRYLEVEGAGRSRVRYPFLAPAFHMVVTVSVYVIFREIYGQSWGMTLA